MDLQSLEEGDNAGIGRCVVWRRHRHRVVAGKQDHKDSLNRYVQVKEGDKDKDHYLNPDDGKLVLLRVQCARDYHRDPNLVITWDDPLKLHPLVEGLKAFKEAPRSILTWTFNDMLRERSVLEGALYPSKEPYKSSDLYWKYPIACLLLTLTALVGPVEGNTYPGGRYPPVRYKYFSYPKTPRNKREAAGSEKTYNATPPHEQSDGTIALGGHVPRELSLQDDGIMDGVLVLRRHLRPRKLCVIRENADASQPAPTNVEVVDSIEWGHDNSANENGEYVFVSYTRAQFHTYTRDDMREWDAPESEDERELRDFMYAQGEIDRQRLLEVGIQAAHDAGVKAFWIDVYCMDDAEARKMDSHRICDVARGAKSMVIALQDTVRSRALAQPAQAVDELLQNWSSRLWTLPEMLLAPTRHDLKIYLARGGVKFCDTIPKRSMAARAYRGRDATLVRQLVDHFEASQQLTLTELLTIGLECLVNRDTNPFMPADQVYALMTMVRRRPMPNENDSLFEAFAKLSLLNDSNSLLERLICTLPRRRGEPWHKLEDFWGAKLWDIEPTVQVSAIASDQTVVLDGGFGATIDWSRLTKVGFLKRKTIWRIIGESIARLAPIWLIISITLLASVSQPSLRNSPILPLGIIFFIVAFSTVAILPYAMLSLYSGKFWSTQALLIGLEGHADIEWLEIQLFGFAQGRLQWSAWGSTQSLHRPRPTADDTMWTEGEVEALEPHDTELENADPMSKSRARLFTIVDTYSMTASLVWADHPPTAALVCGQEGGMRRVLLCSYDYNTQSFHRETVIRMPTKVLDRMDRVDKFRFSIANRPLGTSNGTSH
ncbi:hypothetical protein NUW58_g209 [Xylaria curta]|uniref:Uncharacterized protein n=1 Tax=Xylaria curta TaxID=42375 RepID=A0ACC1PQ29_9PEZI|nr:hypothetical protein NUW58_g209 [Xylaria curta]